MAAKRKSAYFAATEVAQKQQNSETVTPFYGEAAEQLISNTVTRHYLETTFYLTPEQAEKLDDLAHDYKKHTGQRINRNDIVRYLIDQATLDSLEGIKRHVRRTTTQPQEQHDLEERFRTDTQVHHFKKWLRSHDQPQDTDFFKRFLADTRLPQHASRGLYEAKMRTAGYSEEDMHLFHDAWKTMLFTSRDKQP